MAELGNWKWEGDDKEYKKKISQIREIMIIKDWKLGVSTDCDGLLLVKSFNLGAN